MWAGHGSKVTDLKKAISLCFQCVEHISYCNAVEGVVVIKAAPGKGHWLVIHAQHSRMFEPIPEDITEFTVIYISHNGRDEHGVESGFSQVIECLLFNSAEVMPAQRLVG